MSDAVKKGLGFILTGGLSLAAGIALVATGTLPPILATIGTVVAVVANIFGIIVSQPK